MKRILVALVALVPLFAYADIIVTRSNGNIEDVTVISITADNVVYKQDSNQKTIAASEVDGVLYDDGRYITPPSKQTIPADDEVTSSNDSWAKDDVIQEKNVKPKGKNKEKNDDEKTMSKWVDGNITKFNVYAFGKYIGVYYLTDHTYDGTSVEYRIIYKAQQEVPEWQYLGTAPFAYTVPNGGYNPVLISKDAKAISEVRPLEIENFTQVKRVEFRLTKEGYQTVVVSPIFKVDVTGLYYFISLNKLANGAEKESTGGSSASDDNW